MSAIDVATVSSGSSWSAWLPVFWSAVGVYLIYRLWHAGLIQALVGRVESLRGFGVTFDFTVSSAKLTRSTVEDGLKVVRGTICRELEADVRTRRLDSGLKQIIETSRLKDVHDYRATIHIQDPLYQNGLYQLLDYYPRGGGHDRTFSVRAGLIGKVWRTEVWDQWQQHEVITAQILKVDWSMTDKEAQDRRVIDKTKVMLATPLRAPKQGAVVGVLYLDSEEPNIFGGTREEHQNLLGELTGIYDQKMAKDLDKLVHRASRRSPQLKIL